MYYVYFLFLYDLLCSLCVFIFISYCISTDYAYCFPYLIFYQHSMFILFSYLIFYPLIMCIFSYLTSHMDYVYCFSYMMLYPLILCMFFLSGHPPICVCFRI